MGNRFLLHVTPENKLQVNKKPEGQEATLKLSQNILTMFSPLWYEKDLSISKYHIHSREGGHTLQRAFLYNKIKQS